MLQGVPALLYGCELLSEGEEPQASDDPTMLQQHIKSHTNYISLSRPYILSHAPLHVLSTHHAFESANTLPSGSSARHACFSLRCVQAIHFLDWTMVVSIMTITIGIIITSSISVSVIIISSVIISSISGISAREVGREALSPGTATSG